MSYPKTFNVIKLKELAARKYSAREIAKLMGVSRQRIYMVARANGIDVCTVYQRTPKLTDSEK